MRHSVRRLRSRTFGYDDRVEFQIVSHACFAARHGGIELLVDPWLLGSCYWRSWWNLPEPGPEIVARLKPDFIYHTHLHWDHFHGPSLRRFAPGPCMLVPKLPTTRRMVEDLRWLGFTEIVELDHGKTYTLGGSFRVTSYQSGIGSDSLLVVSDGKTTIVDANDCKMFGRSLRQVARDFPEIDFVLRSHSSARPIPYCIDSYPARFAQVRTQEDYEEEFARFTFSLDARYAIPFASNHCYLHRDTIRFNELVTDPQRVHDFTNCEAERLQIRTRAVLMPAGSGWCDRGGFDLVPFDYGRRDAYVEGLLEKHRPLLERSYEQDADCEADIGAVESYFGGLFAALPSRIWARGLFDSRILLELVGRTTRRLLLDLGQRSLRVDPVEHEELIVVRTPARVFNDCCRRRMFSTWSASKRLSISVPPQLGLGPLSRFLMVLDLYELGQLPLRSNAKPRAISQRLRRWREVLDLGSYIWRSRTRRDFRISDLYPLPGPDASQRHEPSHGS